MDFDISTISADHLQAILTRPEDFELDSPELILSMEIVSLGPTVVIPNGIVERLIEWALESADADTALGMVEQVVETLDGINCAGCFAPSGLIYNQDLGREAGQHWAEINEALEDYQHEFGEIPTPANGDAITIGWFVRFAYEWDAYRLANQLRSIFGIERRLS